MWYRVLAFPPRVTEEGAYDPSPRPPLSHASLVMLESFRFEDEGDYEYENISILSIARASQLHFGGKRDSRRHSTTGFSKNVLVVGTNYQM